MSEVMKRVTSRSQKGEDPVWGEEQKDFLRGTGKGTIWRLWEAIRIPLHSKSYL